MKAEIEKETDNGFGVTVYDNNRTKHKIGVLYDGEINGHLQEDYADKPSGRTREETEYGSQARQYAKWHVYRERGYDTLPRAENPDSILAGLLALAQLSEAMFEQHFRDVAAQLRCHYDGSPIKLPFPNADPDDAIIYQKDLYLQPDPTEFDPPVLDQFRARFEGQSDSAEIADPTTLSASEMDTLNFDIEAVSGMHVIHNDGLGNEQVSRGEDPLDRDPDARVELMAFDPTEIDSFQHYVVSNMAYQIRDRFLLMGLTPPAAFQAQGWGSYDGFQAQKFCDLYDDYWSSEATIQSWEPA
ncbi:hypothetical protein [Halomicrobium katesii]|uniref:hypothetical protein n=1 Tax=Halomicrobium katesii TaxID=437163 RepID=UPI000475A56A|nr:hypothetical protein [Halomicrobium katesii]